MVSSVVADSFAGERDSSSIETVFFNIKTSNLLENRRLVMSIVITQDDILHCKAQFIRAILAIVMVKQPSSA